MENLLSHIFRDGANPWTQHQIGSYNECLSEMFDKIIYDKQNNPIIINY